jgi:hypothetical protein
MTKLVLTMLAAAAASIVGVSRVAPGSRVDAPRPVRVAEALAREPSPPAAFVTVIASDRAWAEAERRTQRIPLPAGGNFNGIRWTTQPRLSTAQIEQILEYNALCQWLRARRDGRERRTAGRVLASAPGWPAIRAQPGTVAAVVARTDARLLRGAIDDCDRSHAREVAFARSRRLAPQR